MSYSNWKSFYELIASVSSTSIIFSKIIKTVKIVAASKKKYNLEIIRENFPATLLWLFRSHHVMTIAVKTSDRKPTSSVSKSVRRWCSICEQTGTKGVSKNDKCKHAIVVSSKNFNDQIDCDVGDDDNVHGKIDKNQGKLKQQEPTSPKQQLIIKEVDPNFECLYKISSDRWQYQRRWSPRNPTVLPVNFVFIKNNSFPRAAPKAFCASRRSFS